MRFNFERGFGFIKPEDGGADIFAHARALVYGEDSIAEGNKVTYRGEYNEEKGKWEAYDVRLAPGGEGDFRPEVRENESDEPSGEPQVGIIRRFNFDRGFGFIRPEGDGKDVFCHARSIVDGEDTIKEGYKVDYFLKYNDRTGNMEASHVKVAPGGEGDFRGEVDGPKGKAEGEEGT